MDSNTFKTADPATGRASGSRRALVGAVGAGLVALLATFALDPLGEPFVVVSWVLLTGGLLCALAPGRARSCGLGLAIAGAAPALLLAFWFWLAVSVGVLDGSIH